jgi:hypothetical protein
VRSRRGWCAVVGGAAAWWSPVAWASPVAFTGDVEADFVVPDVAWLADGSARDIGFPSDPVSGMDVRAMAFTYDSATDTLLVGVDTWFDPTWGRDAIAGDVDGNGNPGTIDPSLAPTNADRIDFGGGETFSVAFDVDQDGNYDLIVGVPIGVSLSGFRAAAPDDFVLSFSPGYAFGADLPAHRGPVPRSPSAAAPNLELAVPAFSQVVPSSGADADPRSFRVYAHFDSLDAPSFGRDSVPASLAGADLCIGTDLDADGVSTCQGDCDDLNPVVRPGAAEACDGLDGNCDGLVPAIEVGFPAADCADQDGDGLSRAEERDTWGTNPADPDSDDDGLLDGEEVLQHQTDPLSADSDGGGVSDGDEVRRDLTDPNEAGDDDPDRDGLDNDEEASFGTDPERADSDADGIHDGAEVQTHGTDPLDQDTDGDGLGDGEELLFHGTEPLEPDTDDGGRSDGDEVLQDDTDPLNGADDLADNDGDGIVDLQEQVLGTDPRDPDSDDDGLGDGAEIAVHTTDPLDADTDGGGVEDGDEVGAGLDPRDAGDDVRFYDLDEDGLVDPDEAAYGTDPRDADSDDDGLNDGAEVRVHGTDPLAADTDLDRLDDGSEVGTRGTDPLEPDTDRDGLSDGDEVLDLGTNPLAADTDAGGTGDGDEIEVGTDPLDPKDDLPSGYFAGGLGGCATGGVGRVGWLWIGLVLFGRRRR